MPDATDATEANAPARRSSWRCPSCGGLTVYFGRYDTFGCLACDAFTEPDHCAGVDCDVGFEHLPARPSLAEGGCETHEQMFGARKKVISV